MLCKKTLKWLFTRVAVLKAVNMKNVIYRNTTPYDLVEGEASTASQYYKILAVPGMSCNASRKPPSRSTSHEVR
jgi:hypothetical protein